MRYRFLILVVGLSGCGYEAVPAGTTTKLESLETRFTELESRQLRAEADIENQRRALLSLEKPPVVAPAAAPPPAGSWIAWKSTGYEGSRLYAPIKAKPVYAYATEDACIGAIAYNTKQNGGNEAAHVYQEAADHGVFTYTLTCLPKGVDPR